MKTTQNEVPKFHSWQTQSRPQTWQSGVLKFSQADSAKTMSFTKWSFPNFIRSRLSKDHKPGNLWKYTSLATFVYWNFSNPKQQTTKHDRHSQNKVHKQSTDLRIPSSLGSSFYHTPNRGMTHVSFGDFITCWPFCSLNGNCGHLKDDLDQKLFFQQSKIKNEF